MCTARSLNLFIARLSKTYDFRSPTELDARIKFVQRILQLELITIWLSCLPLRLHRWRKPTNVGQKKTDDERGRYYIDITSRDIFERNRQAIKQREENQQKDIERNRQKGESDEVLKQLS